MLRPKWSATRIGSWPSGACGVAIHVLLLTGGAADGAPGVLVQIVRIVGSDIIRMANGAISFIIERLNRQTEENALGGEKRR